MIWIPVTKQMPQAESPVLVTLDTPNRVVVIARWIPKFYYQDVGDFEGDSEYCEKDDLYYWPGGWYEESMESEISYCLSYNVLAWMELPEPYRG